MNSFTIQGNAFQIGQQLGQFGKEAFHNIIRQSVLWQKVYALKNTEHAVYMQTLTQQTFPLIWAEIEGLAAGLEAPFDEVFAWQCRGDLVRSTSDGCTTVSGFDEAGCMIVAHNEDGMPELSNYCAIVKITPTDGTGFTSFAYPGSICGHTFSCNQYGIVNTVNNIRIVHRPLGLPRQVLARASLNAKTVDDALQILTRSPRSGAFHHTLAQLNHPVIYSVEATAEQCSVSKIMHFPERLGHANHLIHPQLASLQQVITDSSQSRQQQVNQWMETEPAKGVSPQYCLSILSDDHHALPVYRTASDDPDGENTIATAIFVLAESQVQWQIYTNNRIHPVVEGNYTL